MWILRWLLFLILIFFVVGFLSQNAEPKVHVQIISWQSPELPLSFMLFLAALVGYIVSLLVAVINQLRLRSEISAQKRKNQALQSELERLRNFALEEEGTDTGVART
ncbi:MAG: LapA family protein [Calditrichaeota bacterium]|nr:LapA family protein [Calditrichota bacterium]MCB9367803.1 LapA family protein [Calditrichota bacterium]